MTGERYTLHYGDLLLGDVEELNADFPNLFGSFTPRPDWNDLLQTNPALQHIETYRKHSLAVDAELERDCTDANEEIKVLLQAEETLFDELIESENWYLLNEKNEKDWILIPNFVEGGMVWRWNFKD